MNFTNGKRVKIDIARPGYERKAATNRQARIYDRLRKRSYRRWRRADVAWDAWEARALGGDFMAPMPEDSWDGIEHRAYVEGVRDALEALSGR